MARPRHGKRRRVSTDWRVAWLTTGIEPRVGTPGFNPFDMVDPDDTARAAWPAFRDTIMRAFVRAHPGSRPWAWWLLEASEMRARLSGTGTPHPAGPPCFAFGIPTDWLLPGSVYARRYARRAARYVVDPADPPTFESEAAYLQRLGLLLPGERPPKAAFEPERVDIAGMIAERQAWQAERDAARQIVFT